MDAESPSPANDPEFISFRPRLRLTPDEDHVDPESYLRLVANPFLGLLYLVGELVMLYESLFGRFAGPLTPTLVAILIAGFGAVPYLMEYHCLDCGGSGRLLRWRKHTCHRSLMRRDSGRARRFRGPSPPLQVVLWLWALMVLAMLVNAMGLAWSSA